MITKDQLKNLLHKSDFSNLDKLLFCLATCGRAVAVKEVKEMAISNGLRGASKWNVSSLFSRSKGKAILVNDGWELSPDGVLYVTNIAGVTTLPQVHKVAESLRVHVANISSIEVKAYVEEGIECFEHKLYRSAIVLSWVGAVALLHDYVLMNELDNFNTEVSKRDAKWRKAKTIDDLARVKEYDFLQIIEKLSIIGKSVKMELEKQLKLRNGCGHPNSLKISENVVAAHLEILILNVFTKFA